MYGGSVHAESFPLPRDGIPASRADFTDGLPRSTRTSGKRKRDQGLSLNVELPGIDVPSALKPFEAISNGCTVWFDRERGAAYPILVDVPGHRLANPILER